MSDGAARGAWRVHGLVQGVGFRWHTVRNARALALEGRVWNRSDGTVEVHASGSKAGLHALEAWLARGPDAARVDRVDAVEPGDAARGPGFRAVIR